jgi:hypothetical protein
MEESRLVVVHELLADSKKVNIHNIRYPHNHIIFPNPVQTFRQLSSASSIIGNRDFSL